MIGRKKTRTELRMQFVRFEGPDEKFYKLPSLSIILPLSRFQSNLVGTGFRGAFRAKKTVPPSKMGLQNFRGSFFKINEEVFPTSENERAGFDRCVETVDSGSASLAAVCEEKS